MEEILSRILDLRKKINQHNHLYYVKNEQVISDQEYDRLMRDLIELEEQWPQFADPLSPSSRVGDDRNHEFVTRAHRIPMLSLANTYSRLEIEEFHQRISKTLDREVEYTCELKYDGIAISLTYENGRLVQALTRGDGLEGDDVTANIKTIRSIPLIVEGNKIPTLFEIRGEIIMPRPVFDRLNREREENGEPVFANPRNAASGTVKLLNSSQVAKRDLDCFLYALASQELPAANHFECMEYARTWGFKVPHFIRLCRSMDQVLEFVESWREKRKTLPFDTDGIVVKVNQTEVQERLGSTAKSPRWAISYKYPAEQAETQLLSIDFQVGRTGSITPVANLKPVRLAGTIVKRASVHNDDQIKLLNLHLGDFVYIEKGGEIIPKITGVNRSKRDIFATPVQFINHCPDCSTPLTRDDGEARFYCPNTKLCSTQVKGRIEHFISRKAMNIDGLGEETIELLFQSGLIQNAADLYLLTYDQLFPLERLGEKSAENLIASIEQSKKMPWERLLFALGIRFVGETVAKRLAKAFHSVDLLKKATKEELVRVFDIGERIAESVTSYFSDQDNLELIDRLERYGLKLHRADTAEDNDPGEQPLAGQYIVISGSFETVSREQLKEMVENLGGKPTSSVSSNTSFIIAGEKMGPEKQKKAEELGIRMISFGQFMDEFQGC